MFITIAYFVGGRRVEDMVQYNMSQTLPICENYLVVFVSPGIYSKICHEICHAGKKIPTLKNYKKLLVSRNLCQAHLLEVGPTKFPGDHETLSIVRHVGQHVDFSSMKSSLRL